MAAGGGARRVGRARRGLNGFHAVVRLVWRTACRRAPRARAAVAAIPRRQVPKSDSDDDARSRHVLADDAPSVFRIGGARSEEKNPRRAAHRRRLFRGASFRPARDVDRSRLHARRDRWPPRPHRSDLERALLALHARRAEALPSAADSARTVAADRRGRDLARSLRPSRYGDRASACGAWHALRCATWRWCAPREVGRRSGDDRGARLERVRLDRGAHADRDAGATLLGPKPAPRQRDALVIVGRGWTVAPLLLQRRQRLFL